MILRRVHVIPVDQPVNGRVVQLVVEYGPSEVFNGVLDSSNNNDDNQRNRAEARISSSENRETLQSNISQRAESKSETLTERIMMKRK